MQTLKIAVRCLTALALALTGVAADEAAATKLADVQARVSRLRARLDGLAAYAETVRVCENAPRYDRPRAIALAHSATGAANAARFDLLLRLFGLFRVAVGLRLLGAVRLVVHAYRWSTNSFIRPRT